MDGPCLIRGPSIFGYQWKELASTQPGLFFASLLQLEIRLVYVLKRACGAVSLLGTFSLV